MSITEAAKPVIKKPDPKPFRTLHGQNLCDFQRNSYFIIVDDSISLPDLLHPRMWVNNKEKLKRFDTITFALFAVRMGFIQWRQPGSVLA